MEKKPVYESTGLAVMSLCLGILAVITSLPFLLGAYFPWTEHGLETLLSYADLTWCLSPISLIIGIVGLVTGIKSIKKEKEKRQIAIIGIIFNSIALLGAINFIIFLPMLMYG